MNAVDLAEAIAVGEVVIPRTPPSRQWPRCNDALLCHHTVVSHRIDPTGEYIENLLFRLGGHKHFALRTYIHKIILRPT
jgi:hypothetical protein